MCRRSHFKSLLDLFIDIFVSQIFEQGYYTPFLETTGWSLSTWSIWSLVVKKSVQPNETRNLLLTISKSLDADLWKNKLNKIKIPIFSTYCNVGRNKQLAMQNSLENCRNHKFHSRFILQHKLTSFNQFEVTE